MKSSSDGRILLFVTSYYYCYTSSCSYFKNILYIYYLDLDFFLKIYCIFRFRFFLKIYLGLDTDMFVLFYVLNNF